MVNPRTAKITRFIQIISSLFCASSSDFMDKCLENLIKNLNAIFDVHNFIHTSTRLQKFIALRALVSSEYTVKNFVMVWIKCWWFETSFQHMKLRLAHSSVWWTIYHNLMFAATAARNSGSTYNKTFNSVPHTRTHTETSIFINIYDLNRN